MKRTLLVLGLMVAMTTSAFAQKAPQSVSMRNAQVMTKLDHQATVAPVASVEARDVKVTNASAAPRKAYSDGVSYRRPEGTLYVSGSTFVYPYLPAFTEVTWRNASTDKASSVWSFVSSDGESEEMDADENMDLPVTYGKIGRNYIITSWVPTLTVGESSYKLADEFEFESATAVAVINGDSILPATQENLAGGFYTGFSDANVFGTFTRNLYLDEENPDVATPAKVAYIYNFYEKPAAPMCLESIMFRASSTAETFDDFMGMDAEMNIYIIKLDEEGNLTDSIIAELPFNFENITDYEEETRTGTIYKYYATFEVSKKEVDDFGTEFNVPIIIKDAFAVVIGDFSRPDVNFGLFMCDVMATEQDYYYNGGITPTCAQYVKEEDGSAIDGLWPCQTLSPSSPYARQYNGVLFFNCMYDIVNVYDGFEKQYAPTEGGATYAIVEEENEETGETENVGYSFIQYRSTMPRLSDWEGLEGEENYYFEDLPDWLEVGESNDSYYISTDPKYLDPCITLTQLIAAPLPEGVKGRKAEIRIVSDRGADSGVITVIQGEVEEGPSITVDGAAVPVVKTITVNHDEVEKTPYSAKTETFDVAEVVNALGINNISDAAQYIVNVTTNEAVTNTTDGWRNAEGDAAGWGSSAGMVCVKIQNPESGIIDYIGCIDDTHVAGETYTAKWAFVANEKAAVIDVVITFVEKQEQEIIRSLSENVIKARVEYETTEPNYVEKKVELTDDQVNEILADLQLESLAEAEVYGWNPTTEKFDTDFGPTGYDGWRDANGDFHKWTGNTTAPACVKYTDGKTYLCYNINGCEEQEIKCYYAIANDKRAVLVEITFAYVVPSGINEINADEKADAIFNINGVQIVKPQQKGIYIQNGKKVVIK
ncbi:MAG: hypothetical protein J5770_02545 [Bacteroidaceae bacterium]|nr:hypothetical protein [Bacteroidaceae bacterium]